MSTELKWYDDSFPVRQGRDPAIPFNYLLFRPPQGTGKNNMVGENCRVKKIEVKGWLKYRPQGMLAEEQAKAFARILLYVDRKPSVVDVDGDNVVQIPMDGQHRMWGWRDLEHTSRYKVLVDEEYCLERGVVQPRSVYDLTYPANTSEGSNQGEGVIFGKIDNPAAISHAFEERPILGEWHTDAFNVRTHGIHEATVSTAIAPLNPMEGTPTALPWTGNINLAPRTSQVIGTMGTSGSPIITEIPFHRGGADTDTMKPLRLGEEFANTIMTLPEYNPETEDEGLRFKNNGTSISNMRWKWSGDQKSFQLFMDTDIPFWYNYGDAKCTLNDIKMQILWSFQRDRDYTDPDPEIEYYDVVTAYVNSRVRFTDK